VGTRSNRGSVPLEGHIHYSNCLLVDPILKTPTRVALRFLPTGALVRVSRKSGSIIPWPETSKSKSIGYTAEDGHKDTSPENALVTTFEYRHDIESTSLARYSMTKYNRPTT